MTGCRGPHAPEIFNLLQLCSEQRQLRWVTALDKMGMPCLDNLLRVGMRKPYPWGIRFAHSSKHSQDRPSGLDIDLDLGNIGKTSQGMSLLSLIWEDGPYKPSN